MGMIFHSHHSQLNELGLKFELGNEGIKIHSLYQNRALMTDERKLSQGSEQIPSQIKRLRESSLSQKIFFIRTQLSGQKTGQGRTQSCDFMCLT